MSSPPEELSDSPTVRPDFLIRARSGTFTEAVGDAFASLPSRFRRRSADSPTSSSSYGPSHTLSKLVSRMTTKDIKSAKRIGSGGFGAVYLFEHPTKGKVALKQLSVSGTQERDDLRRRALREGDTWSKLKHPNVLPFLGVLETETDLYLVSPYAKNGSLNDYISLNPHANRQDLLLEAAAAIAFLHKNRIVHGDIKASNILVSDDDQALLCDFGLARPDIGATSAGLQGVGTVRYQSPELLMEGGGKTFASDAWAFGMTIYEVLSGSIPFHQYTAYAAVFTAVVLKDERPPTLPGRSASGASYGGLWRVARGCWIKDPAERPSMKNVPRRFAGLLKGHTHCISCLAFSPDGTIIASGSYDHTLRLWDVASGRQRGEPLKGHTDWVGCLAFSPDGIIVASGSFDCTLRLWGVASGSQRGGPLEGHADMVRCLAFSPDGAIIASGSFDHTLRLWDVASGSQRGEPLEGHTDWVGCLAFSPDGTTIASGSSDHTLRLWDVASGSQRGGPLKGHTRWVKCLAFSPDGTTIVSGSWDHTLRLWDVAFGCQIGGPLEGHTRLVSCLVFSPDGTIIASGSSDHTLRLWDVATGSQRGEPLEGHTDYVSCLAFSPDGATIASGSSDNTLRLWDVAPGSQRAGSLVGHTKWIMCLAFSPDGTTIASGSGDNTLRLWDT